MKRYLWLTIIGLIYSLSMNASEYVLINCDRSLYAAGETIWLRGWVTDPEGEAATSKFLFVELLRDGIGSVEQRIKLKERGGMFFGQMELPDDLDSGWYTLRAYTRAQKDWPAEALFHTRVLVRGAGPVMDITNVRSDKNSEDSDIKVELAPGADGHLSFTLTDATGKPVPGIFSLSVVRSRYADFDYQPAPSMTASYIALPEGKREYTQEVDFRVKSVRNRLPDKYGVAIMSQDIGYYYSTDVDGDRSVKGEDGQSFCIPELDFPEGTLFTINTTGSKFISPVEEDESLAFAAPFDYGPTYPEREVIRDTVVIRERFEGTVAPLPADDTITASKITAERKAPWYKHPRMVGPYSHLFEWRQVRLREDMEKYDDMDLLTYIHMNFPSLQIGRGTKGRYMYTSRGASIQRKTGSHHNVSLYIDGMELNDGWTEIQILSVRDVQNLFVLRGPEAALYNSNAVVLLEMRRFDEKMIEEQRKNERKTTIGIIPLGWQKPKSFDASPSLNSDRQGTYYWNPCIRTDAAGRADIALPEFQGKYYLRLEGQTLDGRWFMFSK